MGCVSAVTKLSIVRDPVYPNLADRDALHAIGAALKSPVI